MKTRIIAALAALLLLTACAEKAPETAIVPNVVGLTERTAFDALMNASLSITWDPAEVGTSPIDVDEWVAVGQTQLAGSRVEKMSKVTVQFKRAEEPETEPEAEPDMTPELPGDEPATGGLAAEVEAAFRDSYDWPNDPYYAAITGFSDRDAPRVTVATDLYPKAENESEAKAICMAVMSINEQVIAPFQGVYVTAGEDGPFLAECDNPNY